jgi:hypothetical protein
MSPLAALMPTHAALAEIASPSIGRDAVSASPSSPAAASPSSPAAASPSSPAAASPSSSPSGITFHKYIILQDPATGREHPILFSSALQHSHLGRYDMRAVSAGFVAIHHGHLVIPANMDSLSLNLSPRPQDREILCTWLGLNQPPTSH